MSIKNEAKLWLTPSGYVDPNSDFCNQLRSYGFAVGQLPIDTTFDTSNYNDGKMHPRFLTNSPQARFNRQGFWEHIGGGLACNDNRRANIDFSNFEDNSCPAISMVANTQQYLKSTENLLDTNNWTAYDSVITSVTDDVDPFNENSVYKITAGTSLGTYTRLSGSFNQRLGYGVSQNFITVPDLSYSVFLKRGTQNVQVGLMLKFFLISSNNQNIDNFAIFNFETEQVRFLDNPNYATKSIVNVEKYNNGWYRIQIRFGTSSQVGRYFALYPLKPDLTPEQWKQYYNDDDYITPLADNGQTYLLAKPNVTTRGQRVTAPPEGQNSWASTTGIQPYIKNISTSNAVYNTQTHFRSHLEYATGDVYCFYWDIFVTDDVPRKQNDINSDFFYAYKGRDINNPDDFQGGIAAVVNDPIDETTVVPLPLGRNKIVYQKNQVWINGTLYDSNKDFQIGATSGFGGKFWKLQANTRFFVHNLAVWNKQLTENEILSL